MQRLMDIMSIKPDIADDSETDSSISLEGIDGDIELKNVA